MYDRSAVAHLTRRAAFELARYHLKLASQMASRIKWLDGEAASARRMGRHLGRVKDAAEMAAALMLTGSTLDAAARQVAQQTGLDRVAIEHWGARRHRELVAIRNDHIVKLYSRGIPADAIAEKAGLHPKSVYRIVRRERQRERELSGR